MILKQPILGMKKSLTNLRLFSFIPIKEYIEGIADAITDSIITKVINPLQTINSAVKRNLNRQELQDLNDASPPETRELTIS